REHDPLVRVDVADVLDEGARSLCIAARPDVVDEDVRMLGQVARPPRQDRTGVAGWPTALGHLVTEATERIDLLASQVEVVMDDEDASHVTPPRRCASSGPGGPVLAGVWSLTID